MNFWSLLPKHRIFRKYRRVITVWFSFVMVVLVLAFFLGRTGQASDDGVWVPVEGQALERPITAEGPLSEVGAVTVTAPFDGSIVQRWVQPGDHVKAGAPLLQLDTESIQTELREAKAANIRAMQELEMFERWESNSEVTSAQRQLSSAQRQRQSAAARLREINTLLKKGIVARSELESAQSELASSTEQLQSAKDSLAAALQKGGPLYKQIAELDALTKRKKLELLEERLLSATLTAPVAGVVLKPVKTDGTSAKELEIGTYVTNREPLMVIGDNTKYLVRASLDEFDSTKVKPGMPVEITLNTDDKAIMQGELVRVSSQARASQGYGSGSSAPMFDIEVVIRNVPPALKPRLRLGMSTRLRMVVDKQAAALTVPLDAVRTDAAGRSTVLRKKAGVDDDSPGEEVVIEPGSTLADRVQVLRGLSKQDLVWVPLGSPASESSATTDSSDEEISDSPPTLPFGLGER